MSSLVAKFFSHLRRRGFKQTLRMVKIYGQEKLMGSRSAKLKRLSRAIETHNKLYSVITNLALGLNNGLHPKHKILEYDKYFTDQLAAGDIVLDFGCGTGYLISALAHKAKRVVGIDIDPKHIAACQRNYARENIEYILGDGTTYEFKEKFDVITLSNVLEHIKDRVGLLRRLSELSDKIVLRVPMLTRDWLVVYKKEMGFEYRLDETHEVEFTLDNLQREIAAGGWRIDKHQINWGEFWGVLAKKL